MRLKIALATATAMGLLMGSAMAGDDNQAHIIQQGSGGQNSANIIQEGNGNHAGRLGGSSSMIRQTNNSIGSSGNELMLHQHGNDNRAGATPTSNNGISQTGPSNSIEIDQFTSKNRVNLVEQNNHTSSPIANTLTIKQGSLLEGTATVSGNLISAVRQYKTHSNLNGTANEAELTQSGGTNNVIGGMNGNTSTDIDAGTAGIYQNGLSNFAQVTQTGSSNVLVELRQDGGSTNGSDNSATVEQFGAGNRIGYESGSVRVGIRQSSHVVLGAGNSAFVRQDGLGNNVKTVTQNSDNGATGNDVSLTFTGDDNGAAGLGQLSTGFAAAVAGVFNASASQIGGGNKIGYGALGDANQFGFSQNGANNSAIGLNFTGNNNEIGVEQAGTDNVVNLGAVVGDSNDIGVRQLDGGNTANIDLTNGSDFNAIRVIQDAAIAATNSNTADIDVNGDMNLLNVAQTGDNAMTVNVTGSGNNNTGGNFTGMADGVAGTSLNPGDLFQNGSSTATLTVGGGGASSNNLFAFNQDGAGNSIVGTIDGAAGGNQVAVAQVGSTNTANFSQNGAGNNLGISQ